MRPGIFGNLHDLGFRDLMRIDARHTTSLVVNLHGDFDRFVVRFLEITLQDIHDEIHRRVVVVMKNNRELRRLLKPGAPLFNRYPGVAGIVIFFRMR